MERLKMMQRSNPLQAPCRLRATTGVALALALIVGAATCPVHAADDAGSPGVYLRYGSSARTLALADAVVGLSDDVATAYWNPAGNATLRTMELTGMGATLFEDTQYGLVSLGLPTDRFFFEGFLPVKPGKRRKRLEQLAEYPHTLVIYESVHRLRKSLADIVEVFGERPMCVSREISKFHEEHIRGSAVDIVRHFESKTPKGEFVIVIAGNRKAKG